jgi:hypothetical protein
MAVRRGCLSEGRRRVLGGWFLDGRLGFNQSHTGWVEYSQPLDRDPAVWDGITRD